MRSAALPNLGRPEEATLDAPRGVQVPNGPAPSFKGQVVVVMLDVPERTVIVLLSFQHQTLCRNIETSQADPCVHLADLDDPCIKIDVGGQVIDFALAWLHLLHGREKDQCESSLWISVHRYRSRTPQAVERSRVDEGVNDETGLGNETRHDSPERP